MWRVLGCYFRLSPSGRCIVTLKFCFGQMTTYRTMHLSFWTTVQSVVLDLVSSDILRASWRYLGESVLRLSVRTM